jgi:hypothetical protein
MKKSDHIQELNQNKPSDHRCTQREAAWQHGKLAARSGVVCRLLASAKNEWPMGYWVETGRQRKLIGLKSTKEAHPQSATHAVTPKLVWVNESETCEEKYIIWQEKSRIHWKQAWATNFKKSTESCMNPHDAQHIQSSHTQTQYGQHEYHEIKT